VTLRDFFFPFGSPVLHEECSKLSVHWRDTGKLSSQLHLPSSVKLVCIQKLHACVFSSLTYSMIHAGILRTQCIPNGEGGPCGRGDQLVRTDLPWTGAGLLCFPCLRSRHTWAKELEEFNRKCPQSLSASTAFCLAVHGSILHPSQPDGFESELNEEM
jgi:hypothetical protein